MKNTPKFTFTLVLLFGVMAYGLKAQHCIQTSPYPSGTTAIAWQGTTFITGCNYAGEYSVNNFTAAGNYTITSSASFDYITVTNNSNSPLISGSQPLAVSIPSPGLYRIHISTNSSCFTQSTCRTTQVIGNGTSPLCSTTSAPPPSNSTFYHITSVSLNPTMAVTSGSSLAGYSNVSSPVFSMQIGSTYVWTVTVNNGGMGPTPFGMWIDWDNNNLWNNTNELVYSAPGTNLPSSFLGVITIPSTVTPVNNLRVRIRYIYNGLLNSSCANLPDGETEDYRLSLICPSLPLTISGSSSVNCLHSPQNITLSTTYNSSFGYTWSPTVSNNHSIVVSPLVSTNYQVTIKPLNAVNCPASQTVFPVVVHQSTMSVSMTNTTICNGSTVQVGVIGSPGLIYTWQPGNLSGAIKQFSPNVTTVYTVSATYSIACVPPPYSFTINVNPSPTLAAVISPTSALCADKSSFTLSATGANNYTWQPGNITGGTVVVTPSATISYSVQGSIGNCQESSALALAAYVNSVPIVVANTPSSTICFKTGAVLDASGALSYSWQPFNLSGSNVTSPLLLNSTTFTVTGMDWLGCQNTATVSVNVNPHPAFTYTVNGLSVTVQNNSSPLLSNFKWDFGDQTISTQFQPAPHVYASPGKYNILLEADSPSPCPKVQETYSISAPSYVSGGTGLVENFNSHLVSVYPNPAANHIEIMNHGSGGLGSIIKIYDLSGKLISQVEKADFSSGKYSLDITELPAGYYFIKLNSEKGDILKSFIKN